MASLRLDEVVVDATIAKLQAGWATRAGQISAEKDDGIVCVAPDASLFFKGRMPQLPDWPACFVLAGPAAFREEGPHGMISTLELYVWVCESDETGPLLATRLMRQARAILEVLFDDDPKEALYVAGSDTVLSAYRIFPLRTTPGVVFEPSGQDGWRGSYLITFRAEQIEL